MAAKSYRVLGSDIGLTRYSGVPSAVPLEAADSWGTLDLRVVPGGKGGRRQKGDVRDLGAVSGRENLAQALVVRLLTRQGILSALGHPEYGSRLTELIGCPNDERTRNLARLFTIEAVRQELRVRELLALAVETVPGRPEGIRIGLTVLPRDDEDPLALTLEMTL